MTRAPVLALYRTATALAEPAGGSFLRWRLAHGKEEGARLGERLGRPERPRPEGRVAWLHGASVGEGVALLPLAEALTSRGLQLLVTTGTVNAARAVAGRLPHGALHQYAPLDFPRAVARFLDHWRPSLAIFAESELWPNAVAALGRRGIPLVLVNARMSERSCRRWQHAAGSARTLLEGVAFCLCQTEEDARRFHALGARRVKVVGQLKFDVDVPEPDPDAARAFAAMTHGRPLWLAASTHQDEDPLLLATHRALQARRPDILTIVAPRQPDRGPPLAKAVTAQGDGVARRAAAEAITPRVSVYVADTLGELPLLMRAAPVVFMGKSLAAPGGGQNPIEPARLLRPVLHGPHVANFAAVYAGLDAAGGGRGVETPEALAEAVASLLAAPGEAAAMGRAAAAVAQAESGATARTLAALAPLMDAA